jgi:lipoyl(octanoyl) transferase
MRRMECTFSAARSAARISFARNPRLLSCRPCPRSDVKLAHASISTPSSSGLPRKRVYVYDLHDVVVPYEQAWLWQKELVDQLASRGAGANPQPAENVGYAILLQHEPVYTLGEGSTTEHVKFDMDAPPHPIHRIERGGEVTYHGPGQLVMYPILDLKMLQPDLHWYLRQLEEMIIYSLETVSGIEAGRIDGLTGVWVRNRKVAAIGIRATKWISYHGIALNVTTDLEPFGHIVPCGIKDEDKEVTSVSRELDGDNGFLLAEYAEGLMEGLGESLGLDVIQISGNEALEALGAFGETSERP